MKRVQMIMLFIISFASLLISLKLFWNFGIFVDEYNLSPAIVNGGDFWLTMDWMRLLLLFVLSMITGFGIFKKETIEMERAKK
ncbi:hypothetical protein H9649_06900 [Sporosarcina sp. Sa2YVA2]|uniref:Uncharacterized protein n=1 Tax=Sporosarcina quadrami TaxID=2762234 RepID=A0ABR8U926_9BACL|nr:hypothetical protein [Sporosarcina quadrami]MBD7984300.1 hypothetical protein [Sporosarcina quadrami]